MKKTIIALATVAACMGMTGQAHAKKWYYNVIEDNGGKTQMIGKAEHTCNYHASIKAARAVVGEAKNRFFNIWSEDDEATCPRVSRAAKKALLEATPAQ